MSKLCPFCQNEMNAPWHTPTLCGFNSATPEQKERYELRIELTDANEQLRLAIVDQANTEAELNEAHARIEEQGESLNKANQLIGRLVEALDESGDLIAALCENEGDDGLDGRATSYVLERNSTFLTEARAYLEKGK